jgi:C-lobe and N-lobe beta barrels of Tf-binding protein B
MRIVHSHILWLTTIVVLGGCAGGGGGGGGGSTNLPVVQPFTSWSAVQPNSKVPAQGMSQTMTVSSISSFSAVDTSASSATLTFGASRQLTGLQISAPAGGMSWDSTVPGGGTVGCGNGVCTASKDSGASEALTIDPYFVGWNYQSFGVWQTGSFPNGTFGAMSFGAPTPVSGLPSTGSATYAGLTAGVYVAANGQLSGTSANMSATVNFSNRSVAFTTSGTTLSTPSGTLTARPELNLTGTLTYLSGATQFTGAVNTNTINPSFQLSGNATGRFYGPAAEEIGGVYSLKGAGPLQSMGGGFGGKK